MTNDAWAIVQLRMQVKDAILDEPLIGASINFLHTQKGVSTNVGGWGMIDIPSGKHSIAVNYLGYHSDTILLDIINDTTVVVLLKEVANELETIEVTAQYQSRKNGVIGIDQELFEKMPTFFGEREIVKAIQSLPGVQSGSEGSTSIFVRGGSSDQNLVTLDGIPLFHLSHLFGVLSVFNSDVVQKADLYKSYFSSAFPSRLTSALTVQSKNPSYTEKHFGYQIGVLNTKIYYETPIIQDKLASYIALRGCHAGVYIKPITKSQYKKDGEKGYISYFFYDINAGIHYKIKPKHLLKTSFFFTDDRFKMSEEEERFQTNEDPDMMSIRYREEDLAWRNMNASVQYLGELKSDVFLQQKVYLSSYQLNRGNNRVEEYYIKDSLLGDVSSYNTKYSSIKEIGYQIQVDKTFNRHTLKSGLQSVWRLFNPDKSLREEYQIGELVRNETFNPNTIFTQEYAAFLDYQYIHPVFDLYTGVRGVVYKNGDYQNLSLLPRVSLELKLGNQAVLQLASQINEQNLHMVNGSIGDIMKDYWVPANQHAPSERSWQNSVGYRQQMYGWNWSVDVYHRWSSEQTESSNSFNYKPNEVWESNLISGGVGRSYGAEFYLSKKWKDIQFSIAYNLSKSERKFDALNLGQWYPYTHDRRHDVSAMVSYQINDKWDVSLAWVYGTGRPYSMADVIYPSLRLVDYYANGEYVNQYINAGQEQIHYSESRNNKRLTAFHHLDLGVNYKWQKNKWLQTLNLSIYNIYNHKNVFALFEKHSGIGAQRNMKFQTITLLPMLPSISYAVGF